MINSVAPLHENELFGTLTEEEMSRLAPFCAPFVAIEEAALFAEGRQASRLYLVTEGRIALQKSVRPRHGMHSRRTTVSVCQPGDIVGWSALVEPYQYTLSAVASESSRLISMDAKALRGALATHPEMGYRVMRALSAVMSRRLRQTTEAPINERQVVLGGLKE